MNALMPFDFDGRPLRAQIDGAGDPWFVAADICAALDISNSRDAVARLDDDEKGVVSTDTPGGRQDVQAVNESGLYSLILGSRKPEAKRFKRWVTHEVLPAIRKTGNYSTAVRGEMLRLDEVHRRTGYSPASLRTRKSRGAPLPFPLHKDPVDGCLRVDSRDIEAWVQRVKANPAATPTHQTRLDRAEREHWAAAKQLNGARARYIQASLNILDEVRRLTPAIEYMTKAIGRDNFDTTRKFETMRQLLSELDHNREQVKIRVIAHANQAEAGTRQEPDFVREFSGSSTPQRATATR